MKYRIELETMYGTLTIDDIEATDQEMALAIAEHEAEKAVSMAKVSEIHEYGE